VSETTSGHFHSRRLCVIGVGLIGGSLVRALRAAGAVDEVVGAGRREAPLRKALELGVVDRYDTDLVAAVAGADMVVVAVPLGAIGAVLATVAGHLADDAVLTDVGSAKGSVVSDAVRVFGGVPPRFVPGHPIAGTEKSGVEASFPELFQHRRTILTPLLETDIHALGRVRTMWETVGSEVVEMGVQHHDAVLAATSHLPHMLAYALVECLANLDDRAEIFRYAAGGFRDFTRIASSDPVMWRDVCVANREALLAVLGRFRDDLGRLMAAIDTGDTDTVTAVFQRAKTARDNLYRD